MRIYETKDEAEKVAERLQREHPGAEISDGEISFCGMQDGKMTERRFKTIEVGWEEYDPREGWVDHTSVLIYKSNH